VPTIYSERSSTSFTHSSGPCTAKNDFDHFSSLVFQAAPISGCSGSASSPAPYLLRRFMKASISAEGRRRYAVLFLLE